MTAHPHVRGENATDENKKLICQGSPPRAWGKLRAWHTYWKQIRLTPTCVGKTKARICAKSRHTAHPHVRGENFHDTRAHISHIGSPPRAWGKRIPAKIVAVHTRLTPTCVGKTLKEILTQLSHMAHPHVRGENCTSRVSSDGMGGSPPRAWGKPSMQTATQLATRLTPTCVGKTTR